MKKFSLLIVCLCAGLTFVSQAQDTGRVAPASGDTPSLNGGRPSPWDRPIGPGPRPIVACSNGSSWSGDVTDDGGSSGSPLDALTKAWLKPSGGSGDTVRAPHQGEGGISTVTGMIDGLLNGSTDVPDVNGDGKADISDVTTAINLLLRAQ